MGSSAHIRGAAICASSGATGSGEDHEHVLAITHDLDWALQGLGRYAEARDLAQDTLDRSRRVLGEDHPGTLRSATNLVIDLRALGEADDNP